MNIEPKQLAVLVKKVQTGDQGAFAAIYDEFSQRLYAFIRIKVSNETQAEDILQEVFLRAWRSLKTVNTEDLNLSAWLYKVTSNTINDYYRKKYRQPEEIPIESAKEVASGDNLLETASLELETSNVKVALNNLPGHYKQVIELRYFQDFSVTDVAKIMNKNSVTVRVWQHRALAQLKSLCKKYNKDNER